MNKKRGVLLVVVLIVFLLVFSGMVVAEYTKYPLVRISGWCESDAECSGKKADLNYCTSISGCYLGSCDAADGEELPSNLLSCANGCCMNVVELDEGPDDCGWGIMNGGFSIDDTNKIMKDDYQGGAWEEDADNLRDAIKITLDNDDRGFIDDKYVGQLNSVICNSSDSYWYLCDKNHLNELFEIKEGTELKKYVCTEVNKVMIWLDTQALLEKNDKDDDKVPTPWDCDDNDDTVYGNFSAYGGPEPVVICGDGKVNACGTIVGEDDSCDHNEYSCKNHCLGEKGKCSWITTKDGKQGCCGDDGISDLGVTVESKEGEFICLNKNPDLVGRDGGAKSSPTDISGWDNTICPGDWCWVSAFGNAMFNVLTIKKPGTSPYDVVSNSVNWFACDANSKQTLDQPLDDKATATEVSYVKVANRFQCFKEGSHWSWVECADPKVDIKNKDTIKGKVAGEGLYSIYLEKADPTTGIAYDSTIQIDMDTTKYEDFYGDSYFDFTGYDAFNFMVKFASDSSGKTSIPLSQLIPPSNVRLIIYGPEQKDSSGNSVPLLYFDKTVLGYVVNGPLFEDNWMHVKVPIGNFKGIKMIKIKSEQWQNKVAIKNVYLSKSSEKTKLCSGEDTGDTTGNSNSWLTDIDQSTVGEITGEELCMALYGDNAWLGDYGKQKVDGPSDSCCGNNEDEYYSGDSDNNYGCWNSQPIASGDEIMNVEFQIDYADTVTTISYPKVDVNLFAEWKWIDGSSTQVGFAKKDALSFGEKFELNLADHLGEYITAISAEVTNSNKETTLYLFNNLTKTKFSGTKLNIKKLIDDKEINDIYDITIVVETEKITTLDIPILKTLGSGPETITYSCSDSECLFPLPGKPPYEITNPYPGLYDLYFVESGPKETLIDTPKKKFSVVGNLKAKKVSQQVIFINQDEDKTKGIKEDKGFYGCQASSFIDTLKDKSGTLILKKNLPYCSVKGDKFCSHEGSWSDKDLTQVGYKPDSTIPDTFDLYDSSNVPPTTVFPKFPVPADKRNQSTTVVPGRNFIPNAEFETSSNDIIGWDVFDESVYGVTTKVLDEKKYVGSTEGTSETSVTLPFFFTMRSDKIAVGKNLILSFSQKYTVNTKIYLIDKDGKQTEVKLSEFSKFSTGNNRFVVIEFEGIGLVEEPMLQVIDDLGAVKYSYKPTDETARAGAACCPEDYCWNGYVCVNDMRKYSYMTEKIEKGREYRCVKGNWTYLPPQWDWNFLNYGFCNNEDQCFVSGSDSLGIGSDQYTIEDIYKTGNFPICVNDKEYAFDHYCNKGNWTSRTKFLADKLIDIAGSDDYVLYCTDYKNALVEYSSKDKILGGPTTTSATKVGLLGSTTTSSTNNIQICYSGLTGTTEKETLVPKTKNTCINNVCVLKYGDSGDLKTVFATSLNIDITDSTNSFFNALGVKPDSVNCPTGEGFVKCTATGLKGDLWYSDELNSTIYGKDGLSMSTTTFEKIIEWFSKLFTGEELSKEKQLVGNASVFNELYILNKDDKKVRVIQEVFPTKKTLIAEYENFKTPICKNLENIKVPPEAGVTPLEAASGTQKINCTKEDKTQRFVAIAGLDFWWPQLTGMLRVDD